MVRHGFFALSVLTAFAAPALAADLTAEQTVQRVVTTTNESGEAVREFAAADLVAPGDELKYALVYANGGADAADSVTFVMPVPEEVVFIENSAIKGDAAVSYSADGGETFASRGELTVEIDGVPRTAVAENITHVRWAFNDAIAPGATGSIGYRAILK